ncbi:MAG: 5'/3'-nucleotidase SurE [Candidatus Dormibacteraceae bacterium]
MSPRILVTNDDGIAAPGLLALACKLTALGEVTIVAPEAEQSAVGHSITTRVPLRVKRVEVEGIVRAYAVSGTPADCVKLALGALLGDARPDLVVSGINLGPNTATNVIYSGTVSAATEARIMGVPSFAISLGTFVDPRWETAAGVALRVAREVLTRGLPPGVLLNVNVPNRAPSEVRGVRVTRQGDSSYIDSLEERRDPRDQPYYWLAGSYQMRDVDSSTDALALQHGFVSITPLTFNLTAHDLLEEVAGWGWDEEHRQEQG